MSCLASGRGGSYNVTNPTNAGVPVSEPRAHRGYLKLFLDSVTQADKGVDFDFLRK